MTKYEATQKVKRLNLTETLDEISKKIGISRPTLNIRLNNNNWKVSEIHLIKSL